MNNFIIKVFLLLGVLTFAISCSNVEEIKTVDNSQETLFTKTNPESSKLVLDLSSKINNYNAVHFSSTQGVRKSRGWWKRFWRKVAVVFSDAVGGMIGSVGGPGTAVGGAVVTSGVVGAYVFGSKSEFELKATPMESDEGPFREKAQVLSNDIILNDSIGYKHNLIIYNTLSDSTLLSNISDLPTDRQVDIFIDKLSNYQNIDDSKFADNKSKYSEISNILTKSIEESNSFEDFCSDIESKQIIPTELILVLKEYVSGLNETDLDTNSLEYVNDILRLVNTTKIDETIKRSIEDGMKIGFASHHLWSEKE